MVGKGKEREATERRKGKESVIIIKGKKHRIKREGCRRRGIGEAEEIQGKGEVARTRK